MVRTNKQRLVDGEIDSVWQYMPLIAQLPAANRSILIRLMRFLVQFMRYEAQTKVWIAVAHCRLIC